MGIRTLSQFYYGSEVDKEQHFISIDEGSGEIAIDLNPSGYTFDEHARELQRALNAALVSQTYTVTTNRTTRKYTISATNPFSILAGTGNYAGSIEYTQLGFNPVDKSGLNTYTSDNSIGVVYRPQLPFFTYNPSNLAESTVQGTQDESGSGSVQVVSFGKYSPTSFEMKYITDRLDRPDVIEYSTTAVNDCMEFLKYIRSKNRIEFMPDRNDVSVFEKLLLTKTPQSQNGLEVRLSEMANIQDYYETGLLTFRVIK